MFDCLSKYFTSKGSILEKLIYSSRFDQMMFIICCSYTQDLLIVTPRKKFFIFNKASAKQFTAEDICMNPFGILYFELLSCQILFILLMNFLIHLVQSTCIPRIFNTLILLSN